VRDRHAKREKRFVISITPGFSRVNSQPVKVPRRSLAFNTVLKRGVNDNCVSTRKENRSGGQTTGATFESRN